MGDRIFILMLYVDDIMAVVDAEEPERLKKKILDKLFGKVEFEVGDKTSYLGMEMSLRDEGTIVDMYFYVKQLLEGELVT